MTENQAIRQRLKERRSQLSEEVRWDKAIRAAAALSRHRIFKRSGKIALYIAIGAECPCLPVTLSAKAAGKQLYFPRIDRSHHGRMDFVHSHSATQWQINRFDIPEPLPCHPSEVTTPRTLDMVVMPLVGFDNAGNRLGMGAGYYDRSLAFRRHRQHWRRPLLIGLGYDCQRTDKIPRQPWDVPLDGVATESGLKFFKRNG